MRQGLLLLIIYSLISLQAYSDTFVGVSIFAAQGLNEKQCHRFLKVFEGVNKPAISFVWKSFDRNLFDCVAEFAKHNQNKKHIIQVHFLNGVSRRNGMLSRKDLLPKYNYQRLNKQLAKRGSRISIKLNREAGILKDYLTLISNKDTRIIVSLGLEDNYTNRAFREVENTLRIIFPNTDLSSNDVLNLRNDPSLINERHGAFIKNIPVNCLINFDGYDINFTDKKNKFQKSLSLEELKNEIHRYYNKGCSVFIWWREPQGIEEEHRKIKPDYRDYKIISKQIGIINFILKGY